MPYWVVIFSIVIICPLVGHSQDDSFQRRLKYLNERYDDFFVQRKNDELYRKQRKEGVLVYKANLKADEQAYEAARKQFAARPEQDAKRGELERLYEKKQEVEAARREEIRKAYVKGRQRVESIEKQAKTIPLGQQFELAPELWNPPQKSEPTSLKK